MSKRAAGYAVSVVIPALREAARINRLIEGLRALDRGERCEIIVVDGAPERDTLAAIEDDRVTKLSSSKGRARQMNAGAALSRGDTILFLHADTRLPEHGLDQIEETMADRGLVGGAFGFRFDTDRPILKLLGRMVSVRARLTRLPLGDHGIFLRRDYFARIGGYRDIPIMEDLEIMRRIKRRGDKIRVLASRVVTSPRRLETEGIAWCTIRNVGLIWLYTLGASPERLQRYYRDQPDIDLARQARRG